MQSKMIWVNLAGLGFYFLGQSLWGPLVGILIMVVWTGGEALFQYFTQGTVTFSSGFGILLAVVLGVPEVLALQFGRPDLGEPLSSVLGAGVLGLVSIGPNPRIRGFADDLPQEKRVLARSLLPKWGKTWAWIFGLYGLGRLAWILWGKAS